MELGSLGNASHSMGPLELPSYDLSANPSHIHGKPKHLWGCSNPFPSGSILSFQMDASPHPVTASHYCTPSLQLYHCIPVLHHHYNHTTAPHYCIHHYTPSLHHHYTSSLHHHYTPSLHHHYTPSLHHHYKPVTTNTLWYLVTAPHHYNMITSTTSLHPGFVNYIFLSWNVLP